MSTSDINTASARKYNLEEEGYEWTQHVTRFAMMEHPAISEAFVTDKYPEPPQDADDKDQKKFKKEIAEARIKATATIQKNITEGCLAALRRTPAWTDAELKRDPVAMLKAATGKMIAPHQKRHYLAHRKALEIMVQEASGNVFHTVDKIEVEMQRVKFYNNNKAFSSDDLERWYDEFLAGALSARRFAIFHSEEIRTTESKDLLSVMERVKDWTRGMRNMEKPSDPPSGPTSTIKPTADASTHSALFSEAPTNPNKNNQGTERACSRCGKTGHGRGFLQGTSMVQEMRQHWQIQLHVL